MRSVKRNEQTPKEMTFMGATNWVTADFPLSAGERYNNIPAPETARDFGVQACQ